MVRSELVQRLKHGDVQAIEPLAVEFADLPRMVSSALRRSHKWMASDLLAEANAAMVAAIHEVMERGDSYEGDEIGGFLTVKIRNALHRYLQHNHLVRIPRDAYREMKRRMEAGDDRGYVYINMPLQEWDGQYEKTDCDLSGVCRRLGFDERDQQIIDLLDRGYQQQEVACTLGISGAAVSKRIKAIRNRLLDFRRKTIDPNVMRFSL